MTCTVADCLKPRLARGWCNAHYKRWRKTGDPQGSIPRPRPSHCVNGHRFDKANIYRRMDGKRTCRTCMRFYSRQWHRNARAAGRQFAQAPIEWKTRYQRDIKMGVRVPKTRSKPYDYVTFSLVDLLCLDRGWWTAEALAFRLGLKPNSVQTALKRLERKGRVVQRQLPRVEWKACLGP